MIRWKQALSLLMALLLTATLPAVSFAAPESTAVAEGTAVAGAAWEARTLRSAEIFLGDLEEAGAAAPQTNSRARTGGYSSEYYGDQLPEASRVIYDAIRQSALMDGPAELTIELAYLLPQSARMLPGTVTVTLEEGVYCLDPALDDPESLQNMVSAAHTALVYDYPELSWLINTKPEILYAADGEPTEQDLEALAALEPGDSCILERREVRLTSLTYGMTAGSVRMATVAPEEVEGPDRWQYADTGDRAGLTASLAAAWKDIGSMGGKTDAEKVRAVHDWVCGHVRYADTGSERFLENWRGYQTVWSALVEGESVCAGYARLVKLLLDECGVPCVIVRGESRGESHAWNYVMLSGSWYGIDATWADQNWGIDEQNYLKGSAVFWKDHEEKGLSGSFAFAYPALAKDDYTEEDDPGLNVLPGDVNLDGRVNLTDLASLANALDGVRPLKPAALRNGDLDGSGRIEMADILLLTEMLRKNGYSQGAQPGSGSAVQIRADAETLQPGDMVSVTVSGTGEGICGQLEAAGLELTGISSGLSDAETFVLLPDYGTSSVTYTYRVSARAEAAELRASLVCWTDGSSLQRAADASWSAKVTPSGPAPMPAPDLKPAVSGYEAGLAGGRTYYAKSSGASTKYYLRSASGKMTRVAAPSVRAGSGRFYPVGIGGSVLFPRSAGGRIICYSKFADGMEVPVLNVHAEVSPALKDGYQTGQINGRTYYVKVSGAGMKFYLRSSSGNMTRVAAPSVSAGATRYYPINHGGTVLWPVVHAGQLLRYSTWNGGTEIPLLLPA